MINFDALKVQFKSMLWLWLNGRIEIRSVTELLYFETKIPFSILKLIMLASDLRIIDISSLIFVTVACTVQCFWQSLIWHFLALKIYMHLILYTPLVLITCPFSSSNWPLISLPAVHYIYLIYLDLNICSIELYNHDCFISIKVIPIFWALDVTYCFFNSSCIGWEDLPHRGLFILAGGIYPSSARTIYTTALSLSWTDGRYFYHILGAGLFSGTN